MVPQARFTELLADIEPSPITKSDAAGAHASVRNHLRTHPTFKSRWAGEFLAGSYTRDTAIRPRRTGDGHERADVDIILETTYNSTSDHPDAVLFEVADALKDCYKVERINKRSVRVVTSRAEIDVVPVVKTTTAYELPDRDLGRWKPTNPPAHTTWSSARNTEFNGRFKPLVKLFKWWRRENKTGKRPKGFILEVLVAQHAPKDQMHYGEAFAQMLASIYARYGPYAEAGIKPSIPDPGLNNTGDILSKVSMTDWLAFIERVRVHAGYARRAQDADDMESAGQGQGSNSVILADDHRLHCRVHRANELAQFIRWQRRTRPELAASCRRAARRPRRGCWKRRDPALARKRVIAVRDGQVRLTSEQLLAAASAANPRGLVKVSIGLRAAATAAAARSARGVACPRVE